MSAERMLVEADPGEIIDATAVNAIAVAKRHGLDVVMLHNDTPVNVQPGDTPDGVVSRWHEARREKQPESVYVQGGPWIARHHDWSAVAVFSQEIDALRHAHAHRMDVVQQVQWGEIPRTFEPGTSS